MKLLITIEDSPLGSGRLSIKSELMDGDLSEVPKERLQCWAIGAMEVAKASMLAGRWGINIGNMTPEPKKPKRKRTASRREAGRS